MNSLEDLLHAARNAAEAAAAIHRRGASRLDPEAWTEKGHADWVSEVDHEAEAAAVGAIRETFPNHAIAAEESDWGGPESDDAEVTWYVDPLDGTTNYLHGYPYHSVSIAAVDSQGLAAAVVVNSGRWETFEAMRGEGARMDGHPIAVSKVDELKLALIGTGFPFKKTELLGTYMKQFGEILPRTSGIRRTGSAAIDLCDLACGRLDGFWELHLAPWDVAAGVLILREAGGVITDLAGNDDVIEHGGFIAGNPAIYRELYRLVRSTK
ncbi:MAG: inositol monophosphatase [Gemmatimonadetes bacterium]|uniref:Inositol-1-monophosphatase n=1 Tax=Candidatus Kutchimonas denitrificans TaxID=3056748 RepID=A0AAE4Z964_9BACT|nr:inositol monophosphatase [Gemmatimonadota bacterium]NIR76134.1 inositol monophosphatase [Candidatus Kutchimonas denitrificans]NIS00513.1 inositol monophosphatase [Gemmatimonadota bacterium]NIT66171.1 inositol monophosphatase [Gemmatimonadota bacterium]NIU54249.1 inositol monophosphatase [Gemmatimonadota bacterium]